MWRGPPLADLADEPFAQTEIARLEEQRLAALEARVEADAAAGRHAELVSELRRLVGEHPTRERLAGQLMLALYRCGRQAEALDAYRQARAQKLAGELGVEPGPELRRSRRRSCTRIRRSSSERRCRTSSPPRRVAARRARRRARVAAGALGAGRERPAGRSSRWPARRDRQDAARRRARRGGAPPRRRGRVRVRRGRPPHVLRALGRARAATAADAARAGRRRRARRRRARRRCASWRARWRRSGAGARDRDARRRLETLRPSDALTLEPLGSRRSGRSRALRAGARRRRHRRPSGCSARAAACRGACTRSPASGRARGGAPRRGGRRARRRRPRRAALDGGRAGRRRRRAPDRARARRAPDGDGEPVVCPFKGLASFEVADAPYFFGRERLVAELVARLVGAPLLGVVGPVRQRQVVGRPRRPAPRAGERRAAGQRGLAAGPDPAGRAPGASCDARWRTSSPARRVVLAVDQFEETFTVCRDEEERTRFIAELVRIAQGREGSVVVVALRADFYGRCAAYPELARLLAANHVLVGAMRARRAAAGGRRPGPARRPARRARPRRGARQRRRGRAGRAAAALHGAARAVAAARRAPPAARRLRGHRRRARSGRAARRGGVRPARRAQQPLARTVLLRLAEVEPEGGVERRRLPLEELDADGGEDVASVIGLLADARLLTVSAGTVEFAHEALLREWPRLREWIEDDRDDLRVHRSLSVRRAGVGPPGPGRRRALPRRAAGRGARLGRARRPGPDGAEREFLAASLDRERRDRRAHRRSLAIAFGALALGARRDRRRRTRGDRPAARGRAPAEHRDLARSSRCSPRRRSPSIRSWALRLALWAHDTAPTDQAATALREATLAFRQLGVLRADSLDANAAAYSPDGTRVVTGGTDGRAIVWDVATRRELRGWTAGHGAVLAARYSPAGDRIALGFEDGTVLVTDGSLAAPRRAARGRGRGSRTWRSRGDGARIAAALGRRDGAGGRRGRQRRRRCA